MPQAQNQGLTHDAAGNITSFAPNDSLSYDDANRLIAVNGAFYGNYGYTYDLTGNRIGRRVGPVKTMLTSRREPAQRHQRRRGALFHL